MDTSEQYIKMCDWTEIQEHWREFAVIEERLVWADKTSKDSHANLWLPRQDQIQRMIDGSWVIAFESFSEWYFSRCYPRETYPNDSFTSMEQMWLAFYMYEKHSKIWSSKEEKWVKK